MQLILAFAHVFFLSTLMRPKYSLVYFQREVPRENRQGHPTHTGRVRPARAGLLLHLLELQPGE